MGMNWPGVHDQAEDLQHAVPDPVVERMGEMLGRPEVNRHSDGIPGAEHDPAARRAGAADMRSSMSVCVSCVTDQDLGLVRFIEEHALKPGHLIEFEARHSIADHVRVKGKDDRRITIGMPAASKLLAPIALAFFVLFLSAVGALAQTTDDKFKIADNSFLVEEAFNQEAKIFQNIFTFIRSRSGEWNSTFTQEWPLGGMTHQFSFTIPVASLEGRRGLGDTLINYRYQLWTETDRRPAFAPRLSVVLPTESTTKFLGSGTTGLQVNLPFSKQASDVYFHLNGGFTWMPDSNGASEAFEPVIAGSAIWRAAPMFHPMLEVVGIHSKSAKVGTGREHEITVSPGARWGWNFGDKQLIVGAAVPIAFASGDSSRAFFVYASYELPFSR